MSGSGWKWTLAAAGAFTVVLALFLIAIRSASSPPAVELRVAEAPAADGLVKVYITGAVARPGVYQLQAGDRYGDALSLAGGPSDDAEPLAVNLARRVRDEDHIHVPRRGEAPLTLSSGEVVLDINTASLAQLEALPGIGPVRAQKIIESRSRDGSFRRPDELVQRKLIPESMFESIRERIQVRQ